MKNLACACALVCALELGVPLSAQVATPDAVSASVGKTMAQALKLRAEIANAVLGGELLPEEAISRLRASGSLAGMNIDTDAAFAMAATDVGLRLIAAHAPAKAEMFFRSAEESLNPLIERTADRAALDKAQYLELRSMVRSKYLNKLTEAKADLDAAVQLAPGDKRLKQKRNLLTADPAATLQNPKDRPIKG